jgi:hypothetical protein
LSILSEFSGSWASELAFNASIANLTQETKIAADAYQIRRATALSRVKQVNFMRPLIKRTFVVRYGKTDQGLETIVIDEVKVKPAVLPLRAEDPPPQSSNPGTPLCVQADNVYEEDCSR